MGRDLDLVIRAQGDGFVRISLDEVPDGRYRLYLSYSLMPDGTEFSVWQRQRLIGDWRPSWAERERAVERQPIGELDLGDDGDTVTIRTRAGRGRNAIWAKVFAPAQMSPPT